MTEPAAEQGQHIAAPTSPPATRRRRAQQAAARETATTHDGVLTRAHLRELGVNRWDLRREIANEKWTLVGNRCVLLHTGRVDLRARWRIALHEVGGHAALDGVTALVAAGLQNLQPDVIHVSVPRGARTRPHRGVEIHETRRRRDSDVLDQDIRRVRPSVAAVRAALWAATDRQAALVIVMTAQQRLATPLMIKRALDTVRRDRRRRFLRLVLNDVLDGAQALGELDFSRLCREHGVPPPSRQAVRQGPRGRLYLDAHWDDCDLAAEIEGVHHGAAQSQVDDALRHNTLVSSGTHLLRIPLLGLRVAPGQFMAQVRTARRRLLSR